MNKPTEYWTAEKIRESYEREHKVDRRLSLSEMIWKALGLTNRFKTRDERLEEEYQKFIDIERPELATPEAIRTAKAFFETYLSDEEFRGIIQNQRYAELSTRRIVPDPEKTVTTETRDRLSEFTVRTNDIVIGRRGEMGRCAIVSGEMNGWLCGTGSFVLRVNSSALASFVALAISSPKAKQFLEENAIGVTLKNLNQQILADLEIPLPPLDEQRRVVAEIEGYQKVLDGARQVLAG